MARGRMLGRNAAFLYTDPATGQDVVIDLPAPLRDIRTRVVQRRYVEEALDGTRSVKTIGPAHYELIGRIRFVDAPDAVLAMLHAAANGAQLVYTEDVTDPHAKTYTADLIWDDAAIELGMDADLGKIGRGEVTVVLRSSVPWGALYAGNDVLFRYRAGEPLSAAGMSFSRASTATYIDRTGTLREVGPDVPRIEWLDRDGDGVRETPALRLEPGQTNVLFDSSNFAAAGTSWGTPEHWTITAATSILAGQTAYRHTNDGLAGSRERAQSRGTYTGASETFYVIVENVDATVTEINLRNSTSNINLIARLTWATGLAEVILGTGTAHAVKLASRGPNGGPVYLLAVTGSYTAGQFRRLVVYPTGRSVNTQTVIVHHAQHVEAGLSTSPIVTGAAASATRNVETLYFPLPAAISRPTPLTVYWRGIVGFPESYTGSFLYLWSIAPANGVPPYLALLHRGASQDLRVRYHNGVSAYDATLTSLDYMPGDLLEVVATLGADASVRIVASKNGGPAATHSASGPGALPAAWGPNARINLNSFGDTSQAVTDTLDLVILRGAGWTMDDVRRLVG